MRDIWRKPPEPDEMFQFLDKLAIAVAVPTNKISPSLAPAHGPHPTCSHVGLKDKILRVLQGLIKEAQSIHSRTEKKVQSLYL